MKSFDHPIKSIFSAKARRISKAVYQLDAGLYAFMDESGVIQIWHKNNLSGKNDFILALTDNWQPHGKPREYGIEFIMRVLRYKAIDEFDEYVKARERREEDEKRQRHNEFRAAAADCRKDFAKATNHINTGTL